MAKERDFQDILTDLDDGKVHEQLQKQLQQLVKAVMETGCKGNLALTLNVKRENRGMVVVTAEVKTKLPQKATEATVFWPTEEGGLSRENPRQPTLKHVPLRPPTPIREGEGEATTDEPTKGA